MKRLPVALLLALALPACAQHSAPHAGSGMHSAPSFHGGSSAPVSHAVAPRNFSTAPQHSWAAPVSRTPRFDPRTPAHYASGPAGRVFSPSERNPGPGLHRPPYDPSHRSGGHDGHDRDRDRGRVRGGYRPYYYASSTYLVPGYYPYGDYGNLGYDNGGDQTDQAAQEESAEGGGDPGYGPGPGDEQSTRPPYMAYPTAPSPASSSAPVPEPAAITLVFIDGRPTEQIHNYALTRTTLYVLDAQHQEIPLSQIDIDATQRANRGSGADFNLPTTQN